MTIVICMYHFTPVPRQLQKLKHKQSKNLVNYAFTLLHFILCYLQIEDGEIYATINQRDGMVRFHDNPEKYNSARMLVKLDEEV